MTKKELNELLDCEVGMNGIKRFLLPLLPCLHSVYLFRMSQYHASKNNIYHRFMKRYYQSKLARTYGIIAEPTAIIGKGLKFEHPTSIVIGARVKAGKNLHIYQCVTLGGARIGDSAKGNYPTIGDNVTIFCGSAVLGKIFLNDNVIIAANSTLLQNAPENAICVGSPARIIMKNK